MLIGACVAAFAAVHAQDNGAAAAGSPDYKDMSLEDLMNVEVTSVSKDAEPYGEAPAALDVITSDEISRSGASSIPEALRLADNLEVAQKNSHDWEISARGFNANLDNKLLVLIDGRAVYTPLYGGVLWDVQDYLLEDIDRIEVISGPGGTLWGANAVNGVINITTKNAQDTQGLYLETGGGSELQDFAAGRYGGTLAPGVYYRVYGKYFDRGDEVLNDGSDAMDSWKMGQGGFRIDSVASPENTLTLQGDFYSGDENLEAGGTEAVNGGNILGRWTHIVSDNSDMSLQVYYDRTHLAEPFAASPANPPFYTGFPAGVLIDDLDTYDVDFQHRIRLAEANRFIWGLGYRFTDETDEDLSIIRFLPPTLDQNLFSGFAQDEIALQRNVRLTFGSKLEHNDYTGFEVEPSARLQWNPSPKQMFWAAASRAVRTPSRYDRDLMVPTGLVNPPPPFQFPTNFLTGSDDFVSETVLAYELGYRAQLGSKASTSISTFYNSYNNLRSTTATPTTADYPFPYPIYFQNNLEGHTYGAELGADYQVLDGWRLHAGYDLLRENIHAKPGETDATGATNETADPEQQYSVRSSMDLPQNLQLDATLRWVDTLTINNGPTNGPVTATVPSYFELDVRLGWRPTKRLELSIVGQNLLHAYHQEYGFPSATTEDIQRGVYGKIAWTY